MPTSEGSHMRIMGGNDIVFRPTNTQLGRASIHPEHPPTNTTRSYPNATTTTPTTYRNGPRPGTGAISEIFKTGSRWRSGGVGSRRGKGRKELEKGMKRRKRKERREMIFSGSALRHPVSTLWYVGCTMSYRHQGDLKQGN